MTDKIRLKPIGVIHSPFKEQRGTPIQPPMASGAIGWVEVFPEYEEGLTDLEGFERIWLIYWFDRAGEIRLKVLPYVDNSEHGLFATRAPSRPNHLGFSCVKLLGRQGCRIDIADVDILDKTPLLDIKPYVPKFDIFQVSRAGWCDKQLPSEKRADTRFAN